MEFRICFGFRNSDFNRELRGVHLGAVLAVPRRTVALGTVVERGLRRFAVGLLAAPGLERRGLQRAAVRETHLPREPAELVHCVEVRCGLLLGGFLAVLSLLAVYGIRGPDQMSWNTVSVLPLTVLLVVLCGTLLGSILPLAFQRLGLDPAMMSNPFVAGLIDIIGIVIYINVAILLLP